MISVKVSYTVKKDFVIQNHKNIKSLLEDLKKKTSLAFMYNVFLKEDGVTFLHLSMYESIEVQNLVLNIPSFILFQKERDESGLIEKPKIETLNLIGSSLNTVV